MVRRIFSSVSHWLAIYVVYIFPVIRNRLWEDFLRFSFHQNLEKVFGSPSLGRAKAIEQERLNGKKGVVLHAHKVEITTRNA